MASQEIVDAGAGNLGLQDREFRHIDPPSNLIKLYRTFGT